MSFIGNNQNPVNDLTFCVPSTIVNGYSETKVYKQASEKKRIIRDLADKVSAIYTNFLTEEWHLNEKGQFDSLPKTFPRKEYRALFKETLSGYIIQQLSIEKKCCSFIYLSTHQAPEGALAEIIEKQFKDSVHHLFPERTSTRIFVDLTKNTIEIHMLAQTRSL